MKLLTKLMIAGGAISAPGTPAFTITLDNLVGLTGGGTTNVFMTGSSGGGGVITAKASASRLIGVAPLYVNFDATETTSTLSSNPSHELFFAWDFGDPTAGTWANGVQSPGLTNKNTAYGPIVGHVFETPGTYVVTPVVIDGDPAHTASRTKTIVVQDPNVVYAGALTICISHSGNFTGKPTGALEVNTAGNTDMYAAMNDIADKNNKRILFCKADTWTCSAQNTLTGISGMTLSGYGTGVARSGVFNASASDTLVSVTPAAINGSVFNLDAGNSDIRIHNFKISANSNTKASALNNSVAGILLSKIEVRGCSAGFSAYPGGGGTNNVFDQHCMYECLVDELYGYAGAAGNTPRASSTTSGTSTLSATAHPFAVGYGVQFPTTAPSPLAINTTYYISADSLSTDSFRLAATLADAKAGANSLGSLAAGTHLLTANGISGGIGAFVGFVRGGMIGCYLDSCNHGEQVVRVPYLDRAHINNNYIARPNQGKNILKIHSFVYSEVALYAEKFIVSANVFDLRNGYGYGDVVAGATLTEVGDCGMIISNGGVSGNERVRNCVVENNYTYGHRGQPKTPYFGSFGGPNMTVRNNIADFALGSTSASYAGTYGSRGAVFCFVNSSTPDPTVGVRIYNNSMYCNMDNGTSPMVWIQGAATTQVDIKNNISYQPYIGSWAPTIVYLTGGATIAAYTASNNTTNQNTNPVFVNTPPVALTDWRTTAAWTIDNGATVPVLRDFNNASRYGATYDLGAVLP